MALIDNYPDKLSWQRSILLSIERNGERIHHYVMPRQIGVSSFLIDYANDQVANNKKILFVKNRHGNRMPKPIDSKIDVYSVANIDRNIYGQIYDLIVVDTVKDSDVKYPLFPCLSPNGKMLWINTI